MKFEPHQENKKNIEQLLSEVVVNSIHLMSGAEGNTFVFT